MESADGSARTATGHNSIPAANDRNTKRARTKVRKELNDILYPGALTSRLKRYAAEPAPDGPNLTAISERTANGPVTPPVNLLPERVGQLSGDLLRNGRFVPAVAVGQRIFRHPEGSEQHIPDRKSPGKVGVAAVSERGVVPAVEDRR